MFNKLEISEMFSLGPQAVDPRIGEKRRIHIYPDEKVPDAATFQIWLEDHTLGNILRMELLRNENVLFAGYKVRHPLDHMIELRIQTLPKSNPETALRAAVKNLRGETRSMLEQFDKGVASLKRGEKHAPEVPMESLRRDGPGGSDLDSTDQGGGGGFSSDNAGGQRGGTFDAQMEEVQMEEHIEQLKKLEQEGGSAEFSPASPGGLGAGGTPGTPATPGAAGSGSAAPMEEG